MKRLLWSLGTSFALGALAQAMATKNQGKLLQLLQNLPTSLTLSPDASIEEMTVHKDRLEALIRQKEEELQALEEADRKAQAED